MNPKPKMICMTFQPIKGYTWADYFYDMVRIANDSGIKVELTIKGRIIEVWPGMSVEMVTTKYFPKSTK